MARGDIVVDGRTIIQITDQSAAQAMARADLINRRLERLIDREEDVPRFIEGDVKFIGGQPQITLGGEPILTVGQDDAQYNLTAARDLALLWGGKLSVAVAEARNTRANPLRGVGYLIRYSFRDLIQSIATWLPRLAGAILVWIVFWLLARFSRWLMQSATGRVPLDPNLRQLAIAVAFYGVWAAGFMAILTTLGIDSTSIATAVGISGFVLGFAFKDILSHFFAGLMLLMGRQLHIGGEIVVGQYEGTVEAYRVTARCICGLMITVSSSFPTEMSSPRRLCPILHSRIGGANFFVGIGLRRKRSRKPQTVIMEAIQTTDGVMEEPAPQVLVHELGASSVNLRVLFYTSSMRPDTLQITSECIRHVKEALDRASISIPFEIQNIYIRNLDEIKDWMQELARKDSSIGGLTDQNMKTAASVKGDTKPAQRLSSDGNNGHSRN